jgi:HEAT repeat protein
MSNGDDAADAETALSERLDEAATTLEAAESEADLDDVENTLDGIAADIDETEFEDAEDDEDIATDLEARVESLRADVEAARNPRLDEVSEEIDTAAATLTDSEWTDSGASDAVEAVDTFLTAADEHVHVAVAAGESPDDAATALDAVSGTIADADLDVEADHEAIAALLEAAKTLQTALDAATTWADLSIQEKLDAQGFYDVLNNENRKDFPPEWNAIKAYAQRGEVEPIVTALEKLGDSDFFEQYVFEQLQHMGREATPAFEAVDQRAQRGNEVPIRVLGKMADERATETLLDYLQSDSDPALEQAVLRSLGEIGSSDSTQLVANRLEAGDAEVRSLAARALGLIGDTRAIAPLESVLDDDDAAEVRASAAWALRQIGTERALSVASDHTDDPAYLVQAEAEKAASV